MTFKLDWNDNELKKRIVQVSEKNVLASARRIEAGARGRVAVDNGDLKESIDVVTWKNKGVVGAYVRAGAPGEEHIANFVELGTPGEVYTGGAYKGQERTPIKADPYLRPALRRDKLKFANSFRNAI
jgi:hypothetical protein